MKVLEVPEAPGRPVDDRTLLATDAILLAREYDGDLARLLLAKRMRLDCFEFVTPDVLWRAYRDVNPRAQPKGLHSFFRSRKRNEILIQRYLSPEATETTVAHECGHVRALFLTGDHSEELADHWAAEWWKETRKILDGDASQLMPWPAAKGPKRAIPRWYD